MKHNEFEIGKTFFAAAGFQWLCTDKGSRTITAIMLDPDKKAYWFKGPPYSVKEEVYDEHEMLRCTLNYHDLIRDTEEDLYHPMFTSDDMDKMRITRSSINPYHRKILSRDRVATNGGILHPYDVTYTNEQNHIAVMDLFSKEHFKILADDFVQLPYSNQEARKKQHDIFNIK